MGRDAPTSLILHYLWCAPKLDELVCRIHVNFDSESCSLEKENAVLIYTKRLTKDRYNPSRKDLWIANRFFVTNHWGMDF